MRENEIQETIAQLNGWQNEGKVLNWAFNKLQGNEFLIYMYIVKITVGYKQYTSEILSYERIEKATKVNKRTIARVLPNLISKKFIIKIATNKIAYSGKLPYRYQLNMKLENFPSLGKLKEYRENTTKRDKTIEDKLLKKISNIRTQMLAKGFSEEEVKTEEIKILKNAQYSENTIENYINKNN